MRRSELIYNIVMATGFPVVLIIIPVFISASLMRSFPWVSYWTILSLLFLGFILFLKAKLSLIKEGKLLTFGAKGMSKSNRALYISGYILMLLSLILSLGFLICSGVFTK